MKRLGALGLVVAIFFPLSVFAGDEDFSQILKKAEQLKNDQKYVQALNELTWATTALQKLHVEKLKTFFPASIEGMQPGQFKSENALGFITIERTYSGTNGVSVKASLTGTAATEGAAAQGMGALAGFASMAAMMPQGEGSEVVRIHESRANITNQDGKMELNLPLSSGMFFKLEPSAGKATKDQLVAIATALDVQGLNTYLGTK